MGVAAEAAAPAARAPARPQFQIVPLRGLPFVALVLAGVVVAIARNATWGLTFCHVVGGAAWTTLDLLLGFVIGPTMRRLSVPARIELTTRLMPKLLLILPTLVAMTLAAGFQLARRDGFLDTASTSHPWVVASFCVVAVMAIVALSILQPANIAVLFELRKPQPDPRVIERLMKRFLYTAGITGLMQVATLVIMTRLAS